MDAVKKFVSVFLVITALLVCACAAHAANYAEISRNGRNIAYLDVDSVHNMGDYVTAVTKVLFATREARAGFAKKAKTDADYLLLTFAYNKSARQDQILKAEAVKGDKVVKCDTAVFDPSKWRDIPPSTVGDKIYSAIIK